MKKFLIFIFTVLLVFSTALGFGCSNDENPNDKPSTPIVTPGGDEKEENENENPDENTENPDNSENNDENEDLNNSNNSNGGSATGNDGVDTELDFFD